MSRSTRVAIFSDVTTLSPYSSPPGSRGRHDHDEVVPIGSIGDWYADRADNSAGSRSDDEHVEWTPWVEIPPEHPPLPQHEVDRMRQDAEELRRRNGLGSGPPDRVPPPAVTSTAARPARGNDLDDIPYYVQERVRSMRRAHPTLDARHLYVEMQRVGAVGTLAQVRRVLASRVDSARPAPPITPVDPLTTASPRRGTSSRRVNPDIFCPSCRVRVREQGLCACS